MKTIEIEKHLELNGIVELLPLVMKDRFIYKSENEGIRCMGPFYIKGRYTTVNEVKDFQDVFEFDIFAAKEKLDGNPFKLIYEGYDYKLDNGITLYLHFSVQGVYEEISASSEVEVVSQLDGKKENIPIDTFHIPKFDETSKTGLPFINMGSEGVGDSEAVSSIFYKEELKNHDRSNSEGVSSLYVSKEKDSQMIYEENKVDAVSVDIGNEGVGSDGLSMDAYNEDRDILEIPRFKDSQNKEKEVLKEAQHQPEEIESITPILQELNGEDIQVDEVMSSSVVPDIEDETNLQVMEELFDTKDSVAVSYSFVVVKSDDTYQSIADRYHVDVDRLRSANADKALHERTLLVLPYIKA